MFRSGVPLPKAPAGSVPEGIESVNKLNESFLKPYAMGADIEEKLAGSKQKNALASLFESVMGGGSFGGDFDGGGSNGISRNELARAMLGLSPESPQQESQRKTTEQLGIERGKKDIARGESYRDAADKLKKAKNLVDRIKSIHSKGKDLTGPVVGSKLALKTGMSKKETAKLKSLYGELQGVMAEIQGLGAKVGGLNWARGIKPNTTNAQTTNEAMLDSFDSNLDSTIDDLHSSYSQLTGEPLPVDFNNTIDEGRVETLYKDGKKYAIPGNLVDEALAGGFKRGK